MGHRVTPFDRSVQGSGVRSVAVLWTAAVLALGMTLVGPIASAWAAAPANDGIVPTPNDLGDHCAAGLASNEICQTDNSTVTYYMDSNGEYELEAEDREFVVDAMARYRNNTVLTISYDSTPTFSGSAETDVIYQEGAFGMPDHVSGVTWCNDPVDGSKWRCDQSYIRMRGAGRINAKVATHETGHSFGLLHGNEWDPARNVCADILGVMRAAEDCMDGPALGDAVKNNIDWVYG